MLALVLSFDQFPLRLLGCYGNPSAKTPCLNRIAAESVVFDQHFGEDFSPMPLGHAWWSGCYHFPRAESALLSEMPSLPRVLAAGNIETHWLTDEAACKEVPLPEEVPLTVLEEFPQLIGQGLQVLSDGASKPETPQLLWLKAGRSVWNGSPNAEAESAEVESQLELIDDAIQPLWEGVQAQRQQRRVLFLITAARGMPLGERPPSPGCESTWAEEYVHLPLIVFDAEHPGGERRAELTQSPDLPATLLDFFALNPSEKNEGKSFLPMMHGEELPGRKSLTYGSNTAWEAMRKRDFHFVRCRDPKKMVEHRQLLFMKPDDPWDWHDVASQEPELTETLTAELDAFLTAARTQLPIMEQVQESHREGEAPANPL